MKDVIYRDVKKEDLCEFENLIKDAFNFDKFIHNKELLKVITSSYLKESICESSFIKVASKGDKVLGFILCKADGDKANYNHLFTPLNEEKYPTTLPIENIKDENEITEFIKIKEAYSELLNGKENLFDSCINLFIVSEESRGLGISLDALAPTYLQMSQAMNISPEILHRIASLSSGGLDTLPHNGAVITTLAICSLTHKEAYKDMFVTSVLIPIFTTAVIVLLISMKFAV